MPIADTKKVQSLIQGLLEGQTDIEAGLAILLDSPNWEEKKSGWTLITGGIGIMLLMRAAYFTHNPSLSESNLTSPQAASLNSYYGDLKTAQTNSDADGGYVIFRDTVEQAQTDHTTIITTLKTKDMPSHGTKSLD